MAASWAGSAGLADLLWVGGTLLGLVLSTGWLGAELRAGHVGVDVVAWLALLGALLVDEPLAGAIITLMLTTGRLLDARAQARARHDLTALVERAPRTAVRIVGERSQTVDVSEVGIADRLVVSSGSVVPVDGRLVTAAVLDESSLTGEARPMDRDAGDDVRSGSVNAGEAFQMLATKTSADSTYAQIVRLVDKAQASSAPFVRMADRYAAWFVPLTLVVAVGSWWVSGDPVRAVAVLVVATPCPLLLAAPIAIMSGLSQAARRGVIVKSGSALERLSRGRVLLLDKTGTLTTGRPVLSEVITDGSLTSDEVVSLAGSLEQVSSHVLAGTIVEHASRSGQPLTLPKNASEVHGYGIEGDIDGRRVQVGRLAWLSPGRPPSWVQKVVKRTQLGGCLSVFVAVDGDLHAAVLLEDPLRPDAHRMLRALRTAGFQRVVLVSGDRSDVAESVGRLVGVDAVRSETDPGEKVAVVEQEQVRGPVVMVGDGINDAPALAAASVGVALASQGTTASSETADVILTVDRVDRLAEVMAIARRAQTTALTSVGVGMGLSAAAMVVAAAGWLQPAAGAIAQEAIDVLAIAIALTALRPPPRVIPRFPEDSAMIVRRHLSDHVLVQRTVEHVRTVADGLGDTAMDVDSARVLIDELRSTLLQHERAEERELLPVMSKAMGGTEALVAMSRTHAEIEHQVLALGRLVDSMPAGPPDADDVLDLRRRLYGLYGVLHLHNAQEEEELYSLLEP